MRGRNFCLLSLLMLLAVAVEPPAKGYTDGKPLRFDLYRNYLIVARGSVGSQKGLNFLLDPGLTLPSWTGGWRRNFICKKRQASWQVSTDECKPDWRPCQTCNLARSEETISAWWSKICPSCPRPSRFASMV